MSGGKDQVSRGKRRDFSITKRLIDLDLDVSRCCHAKLRQRRIYPFAICCSDCNADLNFEHEIIFRH